MATTKRTRPTSRRPAAAAKAKPRARRTAKSANRSARALGIGAAVVGIGAAIAGAFAWLRFSDVDEGHAAPDLAGDTHPGPGDRAPEAFRPDMDAPMTASEREALRPATLDA